MTGVLLGMALMLLLWQVGQLARTYREGEALMESNARLLARVERGEATDEEVNEWWQGWARRHPQKWPAMRAKLRAAGRHID